MSAPSPLVLWGGGAVAAALAAWIWIGWTSGDRAAAATRASQLHRAYEKHYPAAGGETTAKALERIRGQQERQKAELAQAESRLLGELPQDYRQEGTDVVTDRVRVDLTAIRESAQAKNISLPKLPIEGISSPTEAQAQRRLLAQTYFLRQVLDVLVAMDVERVTMVRADPPASDPSGTYLILSGAVSVDATQKRMLALLERLRREHERGLGLREVTLTPGAGDRMTAVLSLSLLLRGAASGLSGIRPEAAPPALDAIAPGTTTVGGAPAGGGGSDTGGAFFQQP